MPELTAAEIARFRRKIGDGNTPPAFEDVELQDIWTEAEEDWNKAVLYALEELLGNAWRFTDYTQNESQEKKQQIFANLEKLVARWQKKVDEDKADVKATTQVVITGLRGVPPKRKEQPGEYRKRDDRF